jgi:hypothetical protein
MRGNGRGSDAWEETEHDEGIVQRRDEVTGERGN